MSCTATARSEEKLFAPGYGEFLTGGGGDVEALALAVPTDAVDGPMPAELEKLAEASLATLEAAQSGEWTDVSAVHADLVVAWQGYRAGDVPRLIEPLMTDTISTLGNAIEARDPAAAGLAIEVRRLAVDLQLRYRPVVDVDLARLDLWAAQLILDVTAGGEGAFRADAFAMDYIRDRVVHALTDGDRVAVNVALGTLQVAVADGDMKAGAEAAAALRATLTGIQPAP